jgi:hypothetical protein
MPTTPTTGHWQPIETCPEGVDVILWQPNDKEHYLSEGMIIGKLERNGWEKRNPPFYVNASYVSGYEFECDVERPTHWMILPEAPR